MIGMLTGIVRQKQSDSVIVEVNGVGYQLTMPATDVAALPAVGQTVTVYTHLQVKEDGLYLYGFSTSEKKELFLQLTSVSSVGPRLALALLAHLNVNQIKQAVISSNVDLLSSTPGVGRKTAERVVLELKDKLSLGLADQVAALTEGPLAEAQAALISLGYTPLEASRALANVSDAQTTEQYLKAALKRLETK